MTRRYFLTPAAQRDLDRIWDYTAERWGRRQANRYIGQIRSALDDLEAGKARARSADQIGPSYRYHAVGSHMLFLCDHQSAAFEVVRVLHQSMDAKSRLP